VGAWAARRQAVTSAPADGHRPYFEMPLVGRAPATPRPLAGGLAGSVVLSNAFNLVTDANAFQAQRRLRR
jgi:hypothetical protein